MRKVSTYLKEFETGQKVAIVRDPSEPAYFSKRVYGLTGTVIGKRGDSYIVSLYQGDMLKQLIVKPIHLKKLTSGNKNDKK